MQVVHLTTGLDPERYDVRLCTGTVEAGEADYLELQGGGVAVSLVPGLGRSIRTRGDAMAWFHLRNMMRDFRPDVVHSHTAKAGVLARTAARAAGVPVRIHTFHGHLLQGYFAPPVTAAVVATERRLARGTHRIVAVGERVRDDLLAAGIGRPEQYVVHAPGVKLPPPPTQSAARQALGLPPGAPVVAFVARVTTIKRPDRFLRAAARVASVVPDAIFLVAGGGPLLDRLRREAVASGVPMRFLGWRRDVELIYAAADVAVLTSDNEGMPVSLIEAALCGVPAVTTNAGSAAEVVRDGETGLVTACTADAVAAALLKVIADPDGRRRMGRRARERATNLYGPDTLLRQTSDLYESVHQQHDVSGATRT